ncbi:protein of unknown function DUF35 [Parafrankia sp. EAN1pec]|uniref:Zn-ribbon domain-containing OB-fold protein n=1 Tax=Parafrankia sp. (strain EAN1pec) TaxID=298653 RepID=UPI00015D9F0C|nr:protein of unknown function DUF35 [Frankia sp. EAN1pec]
MTGGAAGGAAVRKPVPLPEPASEGFWAAARDGRLVAQRCTTCRNYLYPPDIVCPRCLTETLEYVHLSGAATLYSFVVMNRAFYAGFAEDLPYVVAFVELDEQPGLRMVSNVVGSDPAALRIGDRLQVEFDDRGTQSVPVFRVREGGSA